VCVRHLAWLSEVCSTPVIDMLYPSAERLTFEQKIATLVYLSIPVRRIHRRSSTRLNDSCKPPEAFSRTKKPHSGHSPAMRRVRPNGRRVDPSGTVSGPVLDTSDWRAARAGSAKAVPVALRSGEGRFEAPRAGVLSPGVREPESQ
jgi:hypothetical protein